MSAADTSSALGSSSHTASADIGLVERGLVALLKVARQGSGSWADVSVRLRYDAETARIEVEGRERSAASEARWPQIGSSPSVGMTLSLAIARQIARLHGCELQWSTLANGMRVWSFALPLDLT